MQSASKKVTLEGVFDRLLQAAGVGRAEDLATFLGRPANTVRSWQQRGSVPLEVLIEVAQRQRVSLDSIVFGFELRTQTASPSRFETSERPGKFDVGPHGGLLAEVVQRVEQTLQARGLNPGPEERTRLFMGVFHFSSDQGRINEAALELLTTALAVASVKPGNKE